MWLGFVCGWLACLVIQPLGADTKKEQQLKQLLQGAATYCQKLKTAAFHYICREKIVETQKPLSPRRNLNRDVAARLGHPMIAKPTGWVERQQIRKTIIRKHLSTYRLLNTGTRIKEERSPTTEQKQDKTKDKSPIGLEGVRFLSSKAVFAPITILSAERQPKYRFRILGNKTLWDRAVTVIEALPRDKKDARFVYGRIWIDRQDFSVLKIRAHPNSIRGYHGLRKLSEELNTHLILNLETEFHHLRDGLRFPTRITFRETYKGGAFISKFRGSSGWKRTHTLTTYDEYLFFTVGTDVKYSEN